MNQLKPESLLMTTERDVQKSCQFSPHVDTDNDKLASLKKKKPGEVSIYFQIVYRL